MQANFKEIGSEGVDWSALVLKWVKFLALVNTALMFQIPQKAGNFLTSSRLSAGQQGQIHFKSSHPTY